MLSENARLAEQSSVAALRHFKWRLSSIIGGRFGALRVAHFAHTTHLTTDSPGLALQHTYRGRPLRRSTASSQAPRRS